MQGTELYNPVNYMQVFTQRKLLIVLITAVTAAISVAFAKLSEPSYTATSTLIVAFQDPVNTNAALPAMLQEEYMATQIGIISSKYMAEKVMDAMDVKFNPRLKSVRERFAEYTSNPDAQRAAIGRWLLNRVRVYVHNKTTRLIKIAFENEDKEVAIAVSNAFSQQYLETALELNLAPIRTSAKWIEENVQPIRKVLSEAEKMLESGSSEKIIDEIESLLDTVQNDMNTLMVMLNYRGLADNLKRNNEHLQELRSRMLGANQALEKSRVLGSRNQAYLAAQSEARYLKGEFLKEFRKQIDSSQVALDSLNQSLVLRSSVRQSNVTLLNLSDVDVESDSVSVKVAAVYGAVLGFMFGVIVAFFSLLGRHSASKVQTPY